MERIRSYNAGDRPEPNLKRAPHSKARSRSVSFSLGKARVNTQWFHDIKIRTCACRSRFADPVGIPKPPDISSGEPAGSCCPGYSCLQAVSRTRFANSCVRDWLHAPNESLPIRVRSSRAFFKEFEEVGARWVELTNSGPRATRDVKPVRVCPLDSRSQTATAVPADFGPNIVFLHISPALK